MRGRFLDEGIDAVLSIYNLGNPSIESSHQHLAVPRRQSRAILSCLASRLEANSSEQLCYLSSPDTQETTARRNLSRLLPHLGCALPKAEVLACLDDQVSLDASHVSCANAGSSGIFHASWPYNTEPIITQTHRTEVKMTREIPQSERDAAIAELDKVRKEWLKRDNVTGVDVGFRFKDGQMTDELAIRVRVRQKLPLDALDKGEAFPECLGDFPVDITESESGPEVMD
jgi:hypothetical protein